MKNHKYTIDAFKWLPRKDGSGSDECYTDEVNVGSILALCYHIIKLLRKSSCSGGRGV